MFLLICENFVGTFALFQSTFSDCKRANFMQFFEKKCVFKNWANFATV